MKVRLDEQKSVQAVYSNKSAFKKSLTLIIVMILMSSSTVFAEKKKTPKAIEGTLYSFFSGDDDMLSIINSKGKEIQGICSAKICKEWSKVGTLPENMAGKRVRIIIGKRNSAEVGEMASFENIEFIK